MNKYWKKEELLKYIGDPLQIAGAVTSVLSEGKAAGVKSVNIRTGGGLDYCILPGRGMDIPFASYKGNALNFSSGTGITSPRYYEEDGLSWLRSFNVGLLTTCGIGYSGMPCQDEGVSLGLHGRISNNEAEDVSISQEWEDEEFVISVKGKLREAAAMQENLSLTRTIKSYLGSSKIKITDVIENHGFTPQPVMMLYHINFGFPLLSSLSELVTPSAKIEPRDDISAACSGVEKCREFSEPVIGADEQAYFHFPATEPDGTTAVGIVNPDIGNGSPLGCSIKYNVNQLPKLFQWKIVRAGFYACGIEPGMAHPIGRKATREKGELYMLEGLGQYNIDLEIEVFDSVEKINLFKEYVNNLKEDN
jgi:acylphosphatase